MSRKRFSFIHLLVRIQFFLTQACLDYYCDNLEPLVSNCEYRATRDNKQEQFCSIPFNQNHSSIGKIQFHFRQNHGNVMKTCAHSIRVYAETKEIPKVEERTLKQAETCSKLTYDYHHHSWIYNIFDFKNCNAKQMVKLLDLQNPNNRLDSFSRKNADFPPENVDFQPKNWQPGEFLEKREGALH
ncbi:hypothetical protein CRE_10907 [Caenorhabditis remanei]|uniref:SUN domain-containing protein n=1 Tax=Caenorhabditis remanei TaxID=31234 RepID=E3M5G8_CAERE|nr:hypothetical protein CRE_10907 [Caenorhabditis remanei]